MPWGRFLNHSTVLEFLDVFSTEHIKALDSQIMTLNEEVDKLQLQVKKQKEEKEDVDRQLKRTCKFFKESRKTRRKTTRRKLSGAKLVATTDNKLKQI